MPSAPRSTSASSTAVSSRRYGSGLPASAPSAIDWSLSVSGRPACGSCPCSRTPRRRRRRPARARVGVDLLDLEVALQRVADRLLLLAVVLQAGEQAVGGEDVQARVRAPRGTSARSGARPRRRPPRRTRARSRSGGGRRRSAARRRPARPGGRRSRRGRPSARACSSCPRRRSASANGSPPVALGERLAGRAVGIGEEAEDGGEVGPRGARQAQPVLLRPRVGALVRADPARAVVLHAHAREEARCACACCRRAPCSPAAAPTAPARAPGRGRPAGARRPACLRVHVGVVAGLGQVDLDHVERAPAASSARSSSSITSYGGAITSSSEPTASGS